MDFRSGQRVWYNDVNREDKLGERAAWVKSVNVEKNTVLVGFFSDPTALRDEVAEVVSPKVLRPRYLPE